MSGLEGKEKLITLRESRRMIIYALRIMWNIDRYTTADFIKNYEYDEILDFAKNNAFCLYALPDKCITPYLYAVATRNFLAAEYTAPNSIWNEDFAKKVAIIMGSIHYIPWKFRTREVYKAAAMGNCAYIEKIPDNIIDQDMCDDLFDYNYESFKYIPDIYKTIRMYSFMYRKNRMHIYNIPPGFISAEIANEYVAKNGNVYSLGVSAISKTTLRICSYCDPVNVFRINKVHRDEKMVEMAVYDKSFNIKRYNNYEITEKIAMLLIALGRLHQKDLPRAFHTTDFAFQVARKYVIHPSLLISDCINEDVNIELFMKLDKKITGTDIINEINTIEFAKRYFADIGLSESLIYTAHETRYKQSRYSI